MITSGLEDYLELIYNTLENGVEIRAVDIAHKFNISRPSVSEALIRLAEEDLIIYEGRKGIKITSKGIKQAQRIIKKHQILFSFFNNILGIEEEISNKNACKIEHVIDDEIISKIEKFNSCCIKNSLAEKFKKNNNND